MWDCFAIDGTIDKMQCWKIRLQLFIFSPLKIFNSKTGQITFPKWPFCKNLSLIQTSIRAFIVFPFLPMLSLYKVRSWAWWMICFLVWVRPVLLLGGGVETIPTLCYIQWSSSAWNPTASTSKSLLCPLPHWTTPSQWCLSLPLKISGQKHILSMALKNLNFTMKATMTMKIKFRLFAAPLFTKSQEVAPHPLCKCTKHYPTIYNTSRAFGNTFWFNVLFFLIFITL